MDRTAPPEALPARLLLWVLLLGGLLALTLNNTYPYQGDESYYTVSAVHMVQHDSWLVPVYFGEPRLQKPILTYWLVAGSYELLGPSLWAGRLPVLILSCLTLLLTWRLALLAMPDPRFGLFAVLLLSSSYLFAGFSRAAMTDPVLAFFTTAALYCMAAALLGDGRQGGRALCAWLCLGLGFLTKGPVALLPLAACVIYLFLVPSASRAAAVRRLFAPGGIGLFLVLALSWYAAVYLRHSGLLADTAARESAHLGRGLSPARYASHLAFYLYTLALLFPLAFAALVRALRRRPRLPPGALLPAVYCVLVVVCYTFLVRDHKDRYLCVAAAPLAVVAAAVLYPSARRRGYAVAAAALALGTAAVLAAYPLVNGEPLRRLVDAWESQPDGGRLGTYELDRRRTGWVLLLSGGRALADTDETDYLIVDERARADLAGATIVAAASERSGVTLRAGPPRFRERTYYLLRR